MPKNILFLGGFFPNQIRAEIVNNSKSHIQFAADALQQSILKGLCHFYKTIQVVNLPFVAPFPTHNKSPYIKTFNFGGNGFNGVNVGYRNIIGVKYVDIYIKSKYYIDEWAKQHIGEKVILIYAAYLPFLKAAIAIKHKYEHVKVCLILPDLPQFMNKPGNAISAVFIKYNEKRLKAAFNKVDYYVLLTKYMIEKLPAEGKKWTVVEGIFDEVDKGIDSLGTTMPEIKKILYTGTLAKRYGILILLEAFSMVKEESCELIICGDGDAKREVLLAAKEDERIVYKGSLDRPVILQMQRSADLLINPRMPEADFTKFSFPSKTMEYLASGVPALLFKLQGIPEEYYSYCFTPDGISAEKLADKITEILKSDKATLVAMGARARKFILENKSPEVQCEKIYKLIEDL